ncbi:hypothetical protein DD238_005030 [Peronospora effusa]|uniref:PHD-type domain-containing protein n=1 Tax=Peronospora effusa TaxID=542832 RepID=A0A3M6VEC1_9STRA|nr:hypothetical protein DD238_005030 [Peronospora effusa]RQM15189.1 hypothetical protein DD237_005630 [Peronospora effusa]
MVDSDLSSGSCSSSSSDSVLIRVPLDQKRRKKLRAQLQEDQRRQRERQSSFAASPSQKARSKPLKTEPDIERIKGEHICVVCEQEGDDLVVCVGPCISAFHVDCLPTNSGAVEAQNEAWLCPNCKNKTHACFHCKRTGIEMLADDTPATTSSESIKRPVRKCRALSCGKFYHQECITQFPLARIAINTHFICPLHTCAGCNQSGAQQEAVRCMRCPVAYHARCLPSNCVRQISSKLIICPKHGGGSIDTENRLECDGVENEGKVAMKNMMYKHVSDVQVQQTENEDEVMSEASVVSVSSARKKEKKREKRDKKKKKKKKKKDKHGGHNDNRDEDGGGKKRKRSKRESLEASGSSNCQRAGMGSPLTPSSRRTGLTVATSSIRSAEARASRSPTSSLALFESPTMATKRIQERLEEALGQSDDDDDDSDSDASMCSPLLKKKRSSYHKSSKQRDVRSMSLSANWVVKEERSGSGASSMMDQYEANEAAKYLVSSSPVPVSPSGDRNLSAARSSAEEDTPRSKGKRKRDRQAGYKEDASIILEQLQSTEGTMKLETPKSPSSSALIPSSSSVATASLVLKHIPSEDDDDGNEGAAESATSPANATLRTVRASSYSKKRRKSKAKREVQRVQRRVSSEEEEEEGTEAKWVQCDSCKKWRTVPRDFDLDAMPKHWYCNMNTWDARFASCAVAEEVVKENLSPQAGKRRYKLKNSKCAARSAGDDGGYSSSESGPLKRCGGSIKKSISDMTMQEEKDKSSRSKNKDKTTKKRKITKQIKEKYREVKWVQCESTQCGKWRIVPTSIDFDRLPAVWYCHLNTWAPDLAKCSAPNPVEVDVFLLKQTKKEGRPSKKATRASLSTGDAASAISVSIASIASGVSGVSGVGMTPTSPVSDFTNLGKSKHGKGSNLALSGSGNVVSIMEGIKNGNSNNVDGGGVGHSTKGRGARGHNNNSSGSSSGIKKTVLEWAQCEKCNKWRKLPQHIKSSTLPDKWYCSMNHWDPTHAKCSVPEETDQEPLPLPPHPGSQWHKGGHKGQRPRRGKLSYSELLYGSTGQLRKAYTEESSILSFEYEGVTYHRDGQYNHSSMYVSPAAMEAAATMAGWSGSDRVKRETTCSHDAARSSSLMISAVSAVNSQASVDHVAALILESMDLRRRRSVSELFNAVNSGNVTSETAPTGLASLAVVTAALGQLEHRGLVVKVTELSSDNEEDEPSRAETLFHGPFSLPTHYRKVPTRPLKASKFWKFGTNVVALSPVKDA